jgi:uncharacterized membrane protein
MPIRPDIAAAIVAMCVASHLCRVGGYFLMRYVRITPRVEAWLRAIPVALMGAILVPVAVRGGPPEWAGLAVAFGAMRLTGNDFLSAIMAMAVVALMRWLGGA